MQIFSNRLQFILTCMNNILLLNNCFSSWVVLGPYLAPSAIDFLHRRMYRCKFSPGVKTDFPPQQTRPSTLAPGEACRRKAELCSCANYTWCYFSDPKRNCATDRQIPGLNALTDSTVGVAMLTCNAVQCVKLHRNIMWIVLFSFFHE